MKEHVTEYQVEGKPYTITIWWERDEYGPNWRFQITELLEDGKKKSRRRSAGYRDPSSALKKATNFIDNHIKPWADSPHNPANK